MSAQPVGGEIHLYVTDEKGCSLFSLKNDSIIWFQNNYENENYRIEVCGKQKNNYSIIFPKTLGTKSSDTMSIGFFWVDSLSITVTKKGLIKKNMKIIITEIKEGKPYFIATSFKPKKYIFTKEEIQKQIQKAENYYPIDLSPLLRK